MIILAAATFWY